MKNIYFLFTAALSALLALPVAANARMTEVKGFRFPEQAVAGQSTLHLNGVGLRQKTIFNVDVYLAGLYLEHPSRDPAKIMGSDDTKMIVLVFLRDLPADKIVAEYNRSFANACGSGCEPLMPRLKQFDAMITDMQRGQEVRFYFGPKGLKIASRGRVHDIEGRDFAETVLSSFIGPQANGDTVREALLSGPRGA